MKYSFHSLAILIVLALLPALPFSVYAANSNQNVLFKTLKTLPKGTAYARIKRIEMKLVRANPQNAYIYFEIGLVQIHPDENAFTHALNLAHAIIKLIKKSTIPISLKMKIVKNINYELQPYPLF